MRQIALSIFWICLIFSAVRAQTVNSANLLKQLLDLPAPAPLNEFLNPTQTVKTVQREPEFYDKNRIPADDAPLEDLIDYWAAQSQNFQRLGYNVKPTEKTIERLLEFCEENPHRLREFLNVLPPKPKVGETVKKIYDRIMQSENPDYSSYQIRQWLVYNSNFFVDEILKKAQKVQDKDEYVTNQTELLALAQVDWEKAVPILERLVDDQAQPVSSALAKWAFYAHALEEDNSADIEKYRKQLQEVVENRAALPGARDLAFDALVKEKDWDGRDDWYVTLLEDETLFDLRVQGRRFTGLTTIVLYSPPEKWIPAMVKLVESKNPAVRKAAIINLGTFLNNPQVDAIRALLPWLSNPKWADEVQGERGRLIAAVGKVDLPESIPGLITILTNEAENRAMAAQSLANYKDSRAVPALKLALSTEESPDVRSLLIKALIACGGMSDDEQLQALEAYATMISTPDGLKQFQSYEYGYYERDGEDEGDEEGNVKPQKPLPLILSVGSFVATQDEPSDGLVYRVIERLKVLRKTKPAVAVALTEIMRAWKGRVIFIERLRQIRENEADLDTILLVLAKRREFREKVPNDVFALRGSGSGVGRGLAPCLTEEQTDFLRLLGGRENAEAQIAMLGCARLLRAKLPVKEVGALLKAANKNLALAAERYLESDDSVEARSLVLAQHQAQAVILGARQAFVPDTKVAYNSEIMNLLFQSVTGRNYYEGNFDFLQENEEKLRLEVKGNPELLAVYAILPNRPAGQQVVRVFKDKITFTNYEDEARFRERTLTAKEYEDFYRFLISEKVDSLAAIDNFCYGCPATQFVMFGRDGGRRVFFPDNYAIAFPPIRILLEKFTAFNSGDLRLRYLLADKIKGLEVLSDDKNLAARAVWKNGNDLRVMVEDRVKQTEILQDLLEKEKTENAVEIDEDDYKLRQERYLAQAKRREEAKYGHFFWRTFENGKFGNFATQPAGAQFLFDETQFPENDGFVSTPRAWQVRAGNYEIRATQNEENSGIFKVSRTQSPVKIKDGRYFNLIVTGDGSWVIASKIETNWGEPFGAVRINLQTGREFKINLPPANTFQPVAFIASQNKVLLLRSKEQTFNYEGEYEREEEEDPKNPSPKTPEYYLLDAATGATQLVKGEFRPLEQQTYRPLQTTATAAHESWAAIYDETAKETSVGRYNTKTFSFLPIIKLPEINLDSMKIWVDESAGKIYFVYEGHFLSVPLVSQ